MVGLAFSWKVNEGYYVPLPADQKEVRQIVNEFKHILEDTSKTKVAQNLKYDYLALKWYDINVKGPFEDSMIAHY